jgi:hypothetical protein
MHFIPPLNVQKYYEISEINYMQTAGPFMDFSNALDTWKSDSGKKFPEIMFFKNPKYDSKTRTFSGLIDWTGRAVKEAAIWEYNITFNEDFSAIDFG